MSIASQNMVPENMKSTVIRIQSYRDKNPTGTFFNSYYGEEIAFGNLTRLLLLMEDMMDSMGNPQASIQSRRFGNVSKKLDRASIKEQLLLSPNQEVIATFIVKVLFRQGASWQGKLTWADENQEVSFRSALEFVKLMDGALSKLEFNYQVANCAVVDVK